MAWVTQPFLDTWRSREYVGANRPRVVVEIRRGYFRRNYYSWEGGENSANFPVIYGESKANPWHPLWIPDPPTWRELPNVSKVEVQNDLNQQGMAVATITMDNVAYTAEAGPGGSYYAIRPGYYAPYRGYQASTRPNPGVPLNDWSRVVDEMAEVRIWMGYGEPVREAGKVVESGGANGTWVFHGLVDDVDPSATPGVMTIVARAGKMLTDSRVFGWNKSKQLKDPVTFVDAEEDDQDDSVVGIVMRAGTQAIRVADVSDMVRVALRWAGFQEWEVEETGVPISGRAVFNRSHFLIDIIKAAIEQTGFTFFIADPTDGSSWGVPTFRRSAATLREPAAISAELTDKDLINSLGAKLTEEPRGYIIRVRGKESRSGRPLGGDRVRRVMAVYRPPWTQDKSAAGVIKHVTHTNYRLRTETDCLAGCYLIAIAEALAAAGVTVETSGLPYIELDDQVGLYAEAAGVNSRMLVESRTIVLAQGAEPTWTMTLNGPLIDTPDLAALIEEILEIDWPGEVPPPAILTGTRTRRIRA